MDAGSGGQRDPQAPQTRVRWPGRRRPRPLLNKCTVARRQGVQAMGMTGTSMRWRTLPGRAGHSPGRPKWGGQCPSPQDLERGEAQGPAAAQSCRKRGPLRLHSRVTATGRDPGERTGTPNMQGAGVRGPQERTCSLGGHCHPGDCRWAPCPAVRSRVGAAPSPGSTESQGQSQSSARSSCVQARPPLHRSPKAWTAPHPHTVTCRPRSPGDTGSPLMSGRGRIRPPTPKQAATAPPGLGRDVL